VLYLDTSAFVKLVVDEPHSRPLRRAVEGRRWIGSEILRVEVPRALGRLPLREKTVSRAAGLLDAMMMVPVDRSALEMAARLTPRALRSLDAIHLASAMLIPGLTALLTYDDRLADAARLHGVPVHRPGVKEPELGSQ